MQYNLIYNLVYLYIRKLYIFSVLVKFIMKVILILPIHITINYIYIYIQYLMVKSRFNKILKSENDFLHYIILLYMYSY